MSIGEPDHPSNWEEIPTHGLQPRIYPASHSIDPAPRTDGPAHESEDQPQAAGDDFETPSDDSEGGAASAMHDAVSRRRAFAKLIDESQAPVIAHRLVEKRRHSERRKIKTRLWMAVGYLFAVVVVTILLRQIYLGWY